jgi:hypothetical protein
MKGGSFKILLTRPPSGFRNSMGQTFTWVVSTICEPILGKFEMRNSNLIKISSLGLGTRPLELGPGRPKIDFLLNWLTWVTIQGILWWRIRIIISTVYLHLSVSSHVQILTVTNFVICRNKNELKSPGKTYRGFFFILFFAKISVTTQKTRIQIDHLLTFNSIITEIKLIDWFLFLIKDLIKHLIFM